MYNKLTCLFGFHNYSKKFIRDKGQHLARVCKVCKRSGYYKFAFGLEGWFDYYEEGNVIRRKYSDGDECWYEYDENGNEIHKRWIHGPTL